MRFLRQAGRAARRVPVLGIPKKGRDPDVPNADTETPTMFAGLRRAIRSPPDPELLHS
jgi:hypothetical protein